MNELEQLALDDAPSTCNYGLLKLGDPRPCDLTATHAACWHVTATYRDSTPNPRAGSGRIECCEHHASYYVNGWTRPRDWAYCVDQAWIEVLE